MLDRLHPGGESGPDTARPTREAAAAILAVMDGLQVQWLLDPDAVDMAAVTRLVADTLATHLAQSDQTTRTGPADRDLPEPGAGTAHRTA
ncbi:hypothetical protein HNR25_004861 [Streptomonospora salina]|uniref:BetI-type transcriptional repressor C-terminal domain-containing protein n=1 Tax=Streptomonospora salina TaxID=104205 RepID=A0A841ED28_9ACTN|nr:hypothetical protein [Streptomonospora salina]